MKVYWTAFYGRSEYTFQGRNAKRDAYRLVKRFGGRVIRTVMPRQSAVDSLKHPPRN
jgi:hypothetical protein